MKSVTKIVAVSALSLIFTSPVLAHDETALFLSEETLPLAEIAKDDARGRVTEIEIEKRGNSFSSQPDKWVYEVLRFNGEDLIKSFIDPKTGATIDSKKVHNFNPFDNDHKEHLTALETATFSLHDAIVKAEKTYDAKAIEAEIEDEDGLYHYEVELLSTTGTIHAVMNPKTGDIFRKTKKEHHQEK